MLSVYLSRSELELRKLNNFNISLVLSYFGNYVVKLRYLVYYDISLPHKCFMTAMDDEYCSLHQYSGQINTDI